MLLMIFTEIVMYKISCTVIVWGTLQLRDKTCRAVAVVPAEWLEA